MEVLESIKVRRSIRKYTNEDISNDVIDKLLEAARLAPSARNRQPWYFMVVKGNLKAKIEDLMIKWHNNSGHEGSTVMATANAMKEAPVLILVFNCGKEKSETSDLLSIGAAIENIILYATELNLGTLWIRDISFVSKEIEQLVNSDMKLVSAISIGYKNQEPNERPRKTIDEIRMYK